MSEELIKKDLEKINKAFDLYALSFGKVSKYELLGDFDLEVIDAFFIRFERIVELLLSKLSKSIEIYETGVCEITLRDRLNLLEKLGVISSTDLWLEMRTLRNKIVHDYIENLFSDMLEIIKSNYDDEIKSSVDKLKEYGRKI